MVSRSSTGNRLSAPIVLVCFLLIAFWYNFREHYVVKHKVQAESTIEVPPVVPSSSSTSSTSSSFASSSSSSREEATTNVSNVSCAEGVKRSLQCPSLTPNNVQGKCTERVTSSKKSIFDWPVDKYLPPACTPLAKKLNKKVADFPKFLEGDVVEVTMSTDYLCKVPDRFYTRIPFSEKEHLVLPRMAREVNCSAVSCEALFANSFVFICSPDAFIGDSSMLGGDDKDKFALQYRDWYGAKFHYQEMAKRGVRVIDVEGLVVQLTAWSGAYFGHFMIDTLIRLSLVYKLLMSDDPMWGSAKIVLDFGMEGMDETWATAPKYLKWILEKLKLEKRVLPGVGWMVKAKSIYRGQYVVLPDVYPLPLCLGNAQVGPYAWGILRPVQEALGVFSNTGKRNLVVYITRPNNHQRGAKREVEEKMLAMVREEITARNAKCHTDLELYLFTSQGTQTDFSIFNRAVMVFGAHGAAGFNSAFCRPGTVVAEFIPLELISNLSKTSHDVAERRDCRQHLFGLSQAANLEYWQIETSNFDFWHPGLVPAIEEVLVALHSAFRKFACE